MYTSERNACISGESKARLSLDESPCVEIFLGLREATSRVTYGYNVAARNTITSSAQTRVMRRE